MSLVEFEPRGRNGKFLAIRIFLEAVLGALGIFLLAAVAAPRLFDIHNNLAVAAAVLTWIACPVLGFLLLADLAKRFRQLRVRS